MNLQQLEYIIAVDRLGSFSKAAEYCHVTQATLSAMVKKLEEELDLVLFDRKTKPILTTDCGQEIIKEAKKVVHHSNELLQLAKSVQGNISGQLKIGVIPTIASSLLPIIVQPVLDQYPALQLSIAEVTTDEITRALKQGELDMGILSTPISDKTIEENILYYESLLVYGDLPTDRQYLLPAEIKEHRVWLFEEGHCLREQFIHLCALNAADQQPQNFNFQANSFETLLNMADRFGGLTLVPELYAKGLSEARRTKLRPFKKPIPVREVSLVYYRPFARFRLIQALTHTITELIRDELMTKGYQNQDMVIAQI